MKDGLALVILAGFALIVLALIGASVPGWLKKRRRKHTRGKRVFDDLL